MSIIIDTSVLSNFASIGQLNLLRSLYGSLYLSTEVYNEIQAGREEGYHFYKGIEQFISPFTSAGWLQLIGMVGKEELRLFGELPSSLHSGDRSCLAIAQERGFIILRHTLPSFLFLLLQGQKETRKDKRMSAACDKEIAFVVVSQFGGLLVVGVGLAAGF